MHQNNKNIISNTATKTVPQKCIGILLFEEMSKNTGFVAQIDGLTGETDTYDSLLQRSIRTAIAMRSRKITSEDVVTVCSHNHLNTNVPLIASYFLGIKTANTDPNLSLSDSIHLLKQVRPKIIFVSPEAITLIEDVLKETKMTAEIVVFGESTKYTQFSEFLQPSPEEKNFVPLEVKNLKDTAVIFFSSGSSGLPKGICLSHLSVLASIIQFPLPENLPPPLVLTYSSPYWVTSLNWLLNNAINKCARLMVPSFDPVNVWKLIEKYKVNLLFLTPNQITTMLKCGPDGSDTSSVAFIVTTGAPFAKDQIEATKEVFKHALVSASYGLTETSGPAITFNIASPEDIRLLNEKSKSCGRPLPGLFYKIADPETDETLGVNQKGELRIKSIYPMNGYYNLDDSEAWDSDGFLKTGDIAYFDEDYCFYIVDRIKEVLKFQSWQISPAMLEGILLNHPAIENAIVIGVPHPSDGDHPMGVVTLNKSFKGKVSPEDIEKYVEERVTDKQKLRGGVKIIDHIPVTPSGKLKKRYIKELVLEGKL